ncbi:MAG: MotA/TolQ/ExbB proton channel family protein [Desulfobacterales bacterium]|jgi:chemotaxis protein MotA|nr:MotA/TolQ/ExbB proton channel family protein [Desulfobacterales bacterium]
MDKRIKEKLETVKGVIQIHRNLVGLVIFLFLFFLGFFFQGQVGLYFNLAGILIVVGGTMGAAMISFRMQRLLIVWKVLRVSFKLREKEPEEIIEVLVDLSLKSKLKGLLSLQEDEEESTVLFLRHALGLLVDGYEVAQIRDFLNTEMYFFRMRRQEIERILRTLAEVCPSFGLVGSVVGLIGMLAGIGDTATILATIPIALTSTLYGVVIANFFFLPMAAHIRERTDHELLLQKIILEGVVAIGSNLHPRALEMKLKSFLTPSLRKGKLVSLERIRERFHIGNVVHVDPPEMPEMPSEPAAD